MTAYRLTWLTTNGQQHAGAPRFLTEAAAQRAGKLLCGDRAVQSVEVVAVVIQPVALPVPPRPAA